PSRQRPSDDGGIYHPRIKRDLRCGGKCTEERERLDRGSQQRADSCRSRKPASPTAARGRQRRLEKVLSPSDGSRPRGAQSGGCQGCGQAERRCQRPIAELMRNLPCQIFEEDRQQIRITSVKPPQLLFGPTRRSATTLACRRGH